MPGVNAGTLTQLNAWGFVPVPSRRRTKHPAVEWKEYQHRKPTNDEIAAWEAEYTGQNCGIVTGAISGVVVIDADSDEARQWCEEQGIPDTPCVQTYRGRHYYFAHPGTDVPTKARIHPTLGIDVRGDGGFVVAPPSRHFDTDRGVESGHVYGWIRTPDDVPLAPLTQWAVDLLAGVSDDDGSDAPPPVHRQNGTAQHGTATSDTDRRRGEAIATAAMVDEETEVRNTPQGGRNTALFKAAANMGEMVASGWITESEVHERLTAAAHAAGLKKRETNLTIASGLKAGKESPRQLPPDRPDFAPHVGWEPPQTEPPGGYADVAPDGPPLEYYSVDVRHDERMHPPAAVPEDDAPLARIYTPTIDNRPPDLPPVVRLNDAQILSVGNITVFTALPGYGKSALCEAITAAAMNPNADTFGFSTPPGARVLYVDGERAPQDHWKSADRTRRRALVPPGGWHPEHVLFQLYAMEPSIARRRAALTHTIAAHRPDIVLLDGLGDFIRDPNDAGEVSEFIYAIDAGAKAGNYGIIVTVHPNPGTDKARGHMGSEVMRRAEAVFLLERNSDGSRTLRSDFTHGKVRNDRDNLKTSFVWSDEHHMFISCANPDKAAERNAAKLEKLATKYAQSPMPYNELARAMAAGEGVSERTGKRWLDDMREKNILAMDRTGQYVDVRIADQGDIPF